jgi:tRNA (guanosine-2'-O-)-methyltransferase
LTIMVAKKNRWRHWRRYFDRLEELMRLSGEELAAEAAEIETGTEPAGLAEDERRRELARRSLTIPFLRDLVLGAANRSPDELAEPRDREFLARWSGTADEASQPSGAGNGLLGEATAPRQQARVAPRRLRLVESVLRERTRSLTVLLDDFSNPLNASAVVRSCEALGLQEIHFCHASGRIALSDGIHKHCHRWLDLYWYRSAEAAASRLRERGFRLLAADFTEESCPLGEIPLDNPLALVFGNEQTGVSRDFRSLVDGYFHIPTCGFTSYINVSNAVALSVAAVDARLREAGLRAPLDAEDARSLRRAWYDALARTAERRREYLAWLDSPPPPLDSPRDRARRHGER